MNDVRSQPAAASDHSLQQAQLPMGMSVQATPKFQMEFSPAAKWDAPVRWKYNHANAPQALAADKAAVIAQLQASFDKWTSQCAVKHQYDGETNTAPNTLINDPAHGGQPDTVSVVGWGPLDSSLGAWTYAWYANAGTQRVLIDADVTLSMTTVNSLADLDRLMTHEWGHGLGLTHSNLETAVMAGPPLTPYSPLVTPQADDVRGCRCLYGLPPGVQAPYVCSLPPTVDFGNATIGMTSVPQNVTFKNSGNAALSIQTSDVLDTAQFKRVSGCGPGTVVPAGESCTAVIAVNPAIAGTTKSRLVLFTNDGFYELPLVANGVLKGEATGASAATVDVIEYYNAALDHYFITWIAAEAANLDAGNTPTKWTRTGRTFKAYTSPQQGTSQVCRFYIPPELGNSHFFGRGTSECNATLAAHPEFILEEPNYMQVAMPTAGACPASTQPVYRVFDNRTDANHRYTTDRTMRDQMVAKGWLAEGDGPDLVVMCAPQ
ncbi:MAG: choice-of-anchor D domain-containing protein [Casimicrobiaceae bacterium]